MSRQVNLQCPQLAAFNSRLAPTHYIGQSFVEFNPTDLARLSDRFQPLIELYAKPQMEFVYDSDEDSDETLSVDSWHRMSKPKSLEYRITGITWHTPRFVNSCNVDNFLSAWVRKMRQTHGKLLTFFSYLIIVFFSLCKYAGFEPEFHFFKLF